MSFIPSAECVFHPLMGLFLGATFSAVEVSSALNVEMVEKKFRSVER